jgi:hypothetical protein
VIEQLRSPPLVLRDFLREVAEASFWHAPHPIPHIPNHYVTRSGLVIRLGRPKAHGKGCRSDRGFLHILSQRTQKHGHRLVNIRVEGKIRTFQVHVIACPVFHGEAPEGRPLVAHRDGVPSNNRWDNLRWKSHKGNVADRQWHMEHGKGVAAPEERESEYDDSRFGGDYYEKFGVDARIGF